MSLGHTSDAEEAARPGRGVEVILGALAVAAAANLAAVLALGGYETEILGVSVRSGTPARPLAILVALLLVRWLTTVRRVGLAASLKGLGPWGAVWALGGALVFAGFAWAREPVVPWWGAAAVLAAVVLGFVLAWLSWGGSSPGASRLVVVVMYVAIAAGVSGSLSDYESWRKTFNLYPPLPKPFESGEQPADRHGLLSGNGTGVTFQKVTIDNDTRNAAVVQPGGFFSTPTSAAKGDALWFSVACEQGPRDCKAIVTAVCSGGREILWQEDASSLEKQWRDVSLPLTVEGDADIVFEVSGAEAKGSVLFANPRIERDGEERPNIILVVVDALRADRLGLYGYGRGTSREIDSLAANAVVFEDCIAQSSWTLPSMASVFTSLYPAAHGLTTALVGLSPDLETFPERLLGGGYFTGCFQVNSLMTPGRGTAAGFAEYFTYPLIELSRDNKNLYVRAEAVNRDALEWLDRRPGGPFMLYLHYMDVHDPYEPPEEFRTFGPTDSDLYDGSIAYFSRRFGEFFEQVRQRGLLENTVVVLTSDHGEQFREHGYIKHRKCLYSEEIHVPLVVWLGGLGGRRVQARVCNLDLAPTLLELAGLEPLADAAGRSLAGVMKGGEIEPVGIFSELVKDLPEEYIVALTVGDYRYIESSPRKGEWTKVELYDLTTDPAEKSNLAADREDTVAEMSRGVKEFISAQRDLREELVKEELLIPLTEEYREKLESLGYMAPGAPSPGRSGRKQPVGLRDKDVGND